MSGTGLLMPKFMKIEKTYNYGLINFMKKVMIYDMKKIGIAFMLKIKRRYMI